jgi:hypothetical protein
MMISHERDVACMRQLRKDKFPDTHRQTMMMWCGRRNAHVTPHHHCHGTSHHIIIVTARHTTSSLSRHVTPHPHCHGTSHHILIVMARHTTSSLSRHVTRHPHCHGTSHHILIVTARFCPTCAIAVLRRLLTAGFEVAGAARPKG